MGDQPFQVLHGRDEQEFVARAGETAQPEPREPEVALHVAEQGLDLFPLNPRPRISLASHQAPGMIARRLVDVTRDPARR